MITSPVSNRGARLAAVAAALLFVHAAHAQPVNVALDRPISADSTRAGDPPEFAVDGVVSPASDIIEIANAPDGKRFARLSITYTGL